MLTNQIQELGDGPFEEYGTTHGYHAIKPDFQIDEPVCIPLSRSLSSMVSEDQNEQHPYPMTGPPAPQGGQGGPVFGLVQGFEPGDKVVFFTHEVASSLGINSLRR